MFKNDIQACFGSAIIFSKTDKNRKKLQLGDAHTENKKK